MSLTMRGISHHRTPMIVRERFYLSAVQVEQLLKKWVALAPTHGFLLLSTCNRLEFYTDLPQEHPVFLECLDDLSQGDLSFFHHLYAHRDQECVQHLFTVACALDSKIIGENQIIGQIKKAFHLAQKCHSLCHQLQRLFEHAFYWARQIKPFSQSLSSGSAAAQWVNQNAHQAQTVLMIGAGDTMQQCLTHYQKPDGCDLILCNRTPKRLERLPYAHTATLLSLEQLPVALRRRPELIIIATSSPQPLLWEHDFCGFDDQTVIIDLSVPRNTEPRLEELPQITLISLDDLPVQNDWNEQRGPLEQKVRFAAKQFMRWLHQDAQRQSIKAYRLEMYQAEQKLLSKALKRLQQGVEPEEVLRRFGHQLTQKLLHEHSVASSEDMLKLITNDIEIF